MKVRKKQKLHGNVYEEAIKRIHHIYDSFDFVWVSFSGGKDSTALLNCALKVARERNKLPLKVVFIDEEAIHPPTIEYVNRVRQNPDIDLDWYCLEFKHRNACSNEEPFWYTWDKEKSNLWVREMPEFAIKEHPQFVKGYTFQEFSCKLFDKSHGRVASMVGIRTEESLRRYQVIARKKNDSYISASADPGSSNYRVFPIYDWSSKDVWTAVAKFGWDYNKTYDVFNMTNLHNKFLAQRVCPPYGEEPLRGLYLYKECWPDLWSKMTSRVKGASTAAIYGNTSLYSNSTDKPSNLTYQNYLNVIIDSFDEPYLTQVKKTINKYIRYHYKATNMKIKQEEPHPITGISWKGLCRVAIRGDFKGRQSGFFAAEGDRIRNKLGITVDEALKRYK